jgi:hypothetical protein
LERPFGTPLLQIPIVNLDPQFWSEHFDMFARKLFLALHYQCYGAILPASGAIWAFPATNTDFANAKWINEFLKIADQIAVPIRNSRALGSQFSIRWNVVPGRRSGVFMAQFHGRVLITGITTDEPELFPPADHVAMLKPFYWND